MTITPGIKCLFRSVESSDEGEGTGGTEESVLSDKKTDDYEKRRNSRSKSNAREERRRFKTPDLKLHSDSAPEEKGRGK